ncbi:hypothetical protein FF36_05981 [Frankia torreyi]|uniref:Uncharacterized protein n=1 Tax=Frankia torreyi TaxID=1856 RepID=A0A0D8B6D9_9ACTN|nr:MULTISPECIES: hypothetical protein [Frankia]KJE19726.1 hypothetical protein FF36_05981 [Frankia torreyi]KQM01775.1 hypothetical protein FF86_11082 [Frankia sp. CpI1-P]
MAKRIDPTDKKAVTRREAVKLAVRTAVVVTVVNADRTPDVDLETRRPGDQGRG